MNFNQIALELARERQEQLIAEMAQARRVQPSRASIRRSIGRRVIAMGERIAAESHLELAQSR
jgi:mannose-6-phosphate isomerase-like protein (cupin superfamily)